MLNILKNIPIFSQLSETELESLKEISTIKNIDDKNILFYQGDESVNLHLLVSGIIEIYKVNHKGKEILMKQCLENELIAEISNYKGINFPASAKSIGRSKILCIDYKEFEKKFLYHPSIAPVILKSIASKAINLEEVISTNLTQDARQRVISFLYNNQELASKLSHSKIAEKLNITAVTFSRILKKLKEEGVLKTDKNNLIKIDISLLEKLLT